MSFTISLTLLKFTSIKLVMPSNHLILCRPLLLLLSIFLSIRVFYNKSVLCIRWPTHWSFSFSISPSFRVDFFRIDWFDLFAVQRTLKSFLQYHNSKASIFWYSGFFMVQLSHPYMTTEKTIALTIWTFGGKVMSLLFNMLFRFVITFLPRIKVKSLNHAWLCDPMDCSLTGSSFCGIFQARILEWVCHFPLQEIFPTQGLNPGLLRCRQTLYHLSHQGRLQGSSVL